MQPLSIKDLKRAAADGGIEALLHAQIESIAQKETRDQKPYRELVVCDADGKLTLRAWSDTPAFVQTAELTGGDFVEISGFFISSANYGVESKRWNCRMLDAKERERLPGGSAELMARQEEDFAFVQKTVEELRDPRLRQLARDFLKEYGARFRRTAAARSYHHARRGGLVEHVAQMMRAARAISEVYPRLNGDLLLCGVLLHDAGKMWENSVPESGFTMPYDELGEMVGHITIGVELVNKLWRDLPLNTWEKSTPSSEDVRMHLLHLIASHHGEMQFGSPVVPKTPEAVALHYIDNLDAKLEMFAAGYQSAAPLAPRIHERFRPLPGNLVLPLEKFGGQTEK
jgi:3'-5' exoribonuclease